MERVNFKTAMRHARPMSINFKTGEVNGYFSDYRVKKETLPKGWRKYDFRGSDDDFGRIATIECQDVIVNYCGTFLTKEIVKVNPMGWRECAEEVNYATI